MRISSLHIYQSVSSRLSSVTSAVHITSEYNETKLLPVALWYSYLWIGTHESPAVPCAGSKTSRRVLLGSPDTHPNKHIIMGSLNVCRSLFGPPWHNGSDEALKALLGNINHIHWTPHHE